MGLRRGHSSYEAPLADIIRRKEPGWSLASKLPTLLNPKSTLATMTLDSDATAKGSLVTGSVPQLSL